MLLLFLDASKLIIYAYKSCVSCSSDIPNNIRGGTDSTAVEVVPLETSKDISKKYLLMKG